MKYIILAIGDELLAGQVTDTNSGVIARMLEPAGFELARVEVIADTGEALREALTRALQDVHLVLTTGGLGPTKDDQTKQTLCSLFGGQMVEDPQVLENVRQIVERRGISLNRLTAAQAMVPDCADIIQNEVGTAPIMWFERPDDRVVVTLPGVPFECEQMMDRRVKRLIKNRFPQRDRLERRTVMAFDITESALAQILEPWEDALPSYAHLAYLPKPGVLRLRLDLHNAPEGEAERLKQELIERIPAENLMATEDILPQARVLQLLARNGLTMATAESCTGGTIASRITALPGASAAFKGGVVSYSNDMKHSALGVSANDLEQHGAVSQPVVEQMARGVLELTGADLAVSTSGIAGPSGGTAEKPVGTVWMAVATPDGVESQCFRFPGSRDRVIDRAATTAFLLLLKKLLPLEKR